MTDYAATEPRVSTAGFEIGAAGITPPLNPNRRGVFLADVIVELGLVDQETIDQAQQAAQETERSLERYLLEEGVLDEDGLSRAIAERNGLDHVDLDQFEVDMEAAQMVARSAAERYRAVPVASASDGALIVAVQDPFDTLGISDIEVMARSSVRPAIATPAGIEAVIERLLDQPVSRPPLVELEIEESPREGSIEASPEEIANGNGAPSMDFEVFQPGGEPEGEVEPVVELESSEEEPLAQAESIAEFGSPTGFEPSPGVDAGNEQEGQPVDEMEPEGQPVDEVEPESEPVDEVVPEREPVEEMEPATEPADEVRPAVELANSVGPPPKADRDVEFELVQFPEPEPELEVVEEEPQPEPDVVFDLNPELLQLPQPGGAGVSDLESELGSLQETARRADELAATVERRISELKGDTVERTERLEADLAAAQRRVEELEAQASGVDSLADELRATTAKLEEVNRVLEGSVR